MKEIKLAKTAGFCFGVDRAVNLVYSLVEKNEKCCTLGPIIHNQQLVDDLNSKGVLTIDNPSECPRDYKIVVRTHGVEKNVIDEIENAGIEYINATCPFVLKIHNIVKAEQKGTVTLIAGDENHPEVMGIRSFCVDDTYVFKNEEELENLVKIHDLSKKENLICVSQTTFSVEEWKKCNKILKKVCTNCKIFDTICNATSDRQAEAYSLSLECDAMVVVGGRHSSNTSKLKNVCSENCPAFLIETADELSSIDFSVYDKVGVTAGASTPAVIIKEVLKSMSEEIKEKEVEATAEEVAETAETADKAATAAVEASADGEASFAELLEQSFQNEDTGKVVKGVVVNITPTEVFVDVPGRKQTGVIDADDLSSEPFDKCEDVVSIGDELNLVILKTDDASGVLKLSKKLTDAYKGWENIVKAQEEKEIVEGVVAAIVRGGILVSAMGSRVFIPGSLTGLAKEEDLNLLKGTTVRFKIIDIDKLRRRAVGSIKAVINAERKAARDAFWAEVEEGQKFTGTVKSLTSYGAFVDLGGVDGMIHISELSWTRIKHPSEVVKVGDVVEVTIKKLNTETKKISLGFKKVEDNPWAILERDYPVGTDVEVKVVGLASFGAFANILPGLDGLIHISQISKDRIKTPADGCKVGDVLKARITDIDFDKKRVSLSVKACLEDAEETADEAEIADEPAEDAE